MHLTFEELLQHQHHVGVLRRHPGQLGQRLGIGPHLEHGLQQPVGGLDWTIVRASGLFSNHERTQYEVQEDQADGLFTAREDLAASMLEQLDGDSFVRKAMAVITTQVRPRIAQVIWREAIMSK